ncbi:aryl-sulfate sulfotransferase [Diplocloster agilis]|uniref:aryl-sulfate sulfotransferase n=1 Tax=Diplocloster agilis TaxID=2850323 RepID=UPI0008214DAF|nr:aryl-sulfate sulfotransferase [Suonthocola fibrivorans]MCU6732351.1 aryl-sulfate sulfotransferase [Suonthocola fibrivorans]SCI44141.1 Arylsulfotransferase (ASST) [uncultured Clostridium sp.]
MINKSSRAVLYRVDEDQMTVEKLWASDRDLGIEGNSAVMGNADYLGTGHYWIDFSATMFDNEGRQTQGYWDFLTAPVQNCLFVELLNDEVVFKARYNGNFCTCYRSHVYMPYWAGNEWK